MGKKGRIKVEKEFDEKKVIDKYLSMINILINNSEAGKSPLWNWVFMLACVVVALFSLSSGEIVINPVLAFDWSDKLLHFLIFAILCYTGLKVFYPKIFRLCLGLLLLGAIIEVAQIYRDSRHAELGDFIANLFGIILGVVIFKIHNRRFFG